MFKKAIPVFAEGKCREMNTHLTLRAETESLKGTKLYISAVSFYRLWVNGEFVFFGPTRAARGYARINCIDLDKYSREGKNSLKIEVVGYGCNTLTTVNDPSFVAAELRRGDEVLLCTGRDFEGFITGRKVQKVERYSVQRHFEELWDLRGEAYSEDKRVKLTPSENSPIFLSECAPAPFTGDVAASSITSYGSFSFDESLPVRMNRYSWKTLEKSWGRFDEEEIEHFPHRWIQQQSFSLKGRDGKLPAELCEGEYLLFDMGMIYAGFLTFSAEALEESDIIIGYTELCDPDKFEFSNINCQNVIEYFLPKGHKDPLMTFEPYTCKSAVVMVKKGRIRLDYFGMKRFEFDTKNIIEREIKDPELKRIYDAAIRTFCHNIVDIYMDCPSRERAGWLGDSFFIGKVEHFLTGKSRVEDIFLENYRLCKTLKLPEGVLPECYPSDFENNFIPQWNLWYILEVCEYLTVRNTSVDKEIFRKSVYGILNFFEKYENENGMAVNLPSWNFVEWSKANEWVQDLSYPTNFLYAEAMRVTGELYGDKTLLEKSEKLKAVTRKLSFNGEIFIDNAVFDEKGVLRNTENFSEAGQYYAILFGGADMNAPEYAKLKEHILNNFSSFDPEAENFVPVNVFIGFLLKLLVFMDYKMMDLLRETIKGFFGPMVDATGTIWEYKFKQRKGSYDHGFSSLAAIVAWELDK